MNKDDEFNAAAIVPTQRKLLKMVIKKKLQNMVFVSNKNGLQSFYYATFFF